MALLDPSSCRPSITWKRREGKEQDGWEDGRFERTSQQETSNQDKVVSWSFAPFLTFFHLSFIYFLQHIYTVFIYIYIYIYICYSFLFSSPPACHYLSSVFLFHLCLYLFTCITISKSKPDVGVVWSPISSRLRCVSLMTSSETRRKPCVGISG